jgi:hypothetical protein
MYPYKDKHHPPIKRSKKPLAPGGAAVECPGAPVECPGAPVEYRGAAVECPGAAVEPAAGPGPNPGALLT